MGGGGGEKEKEKLGKWGEGIEVRHRHDDCFVRLRNDLKGITSLMNHQAQRVMDDCNRTDAQTQRANGDTHQHAPSR